MISLQHNVIHLQHDMKMEAERLRQEEEAKLKKKMNAKKAKEEAERHHAVRISFRTF